MTYELVRYDAERNYSTWKNSDGEIRSVEGGTRLTAEMERKLDILFAPVPQKVYDVIDELRTIYQERIRSAGSTLTGR